MKDALPLYCITELGQGRAATTLFMHFYEVFVAETRANI